MELHPHYWVRPEHWPLSLRRPQGLDPPPERRLDDTYRLDEHSRTAIRPWAWLDDDIVNTFLRCLCSIQPGQFVTLDSSTLELLRFIDSESAPDEFDKALKPLRTLAATVSGNNGLVFIPFCLNQHWILAVADLGQRIIRIYESLAECDQNGRVKMSDDVRDIVVPLAKHILSFCLDAEKWTVVPFWLPVLPNFTECGVYICMMALQHCYNRRFSLRDYVKTLQDEDGVSRHYQLDEYYWLTGRRIILQVCARFFSSAAGFAGWEEDGHLASELDKYFNGGPVQQFNGSHSYHTARSFTFRRVNDALAWASNSIASLAYPTSEHRNAQIHSRALCPVLTWSGQRFRNEIEEEAGKYAWHDPAPLVRLMWDIDTAFNTLRREERNSQIRLANRLAFEAQILAQAGITSPSQHSGTNGSDSSPGHPPSSN